jgi:hypothetical protein
VTPAPGVQLGGEDPLWPFATLAEADHWKNVEAPNGHSPWHNDAKATALFFVTGYLQFHDITKVTSVDVSGAEADIGVGYDLPSGAEHTASVIHLLRFGDDSGPWEVVRAIADGFALTTVAFGDNPPTMVGGRITGVDESVSAAIRTLDGAFDQGGPVPAGGEDAEWSLNVPSTVRGTATVVAWTGGHLTAHERFAVSALKTMR